MDASKNRISWFGQVKVYMGKCFRLFVHEKQWKNFITAAILMAIISLVTNEKLFCDFWETKYGIFTITCGCIWIGLFNSIQSICRERAIIKREHRTGLRLSSYITAHAVYEAFLCAIEALIILVMLYIKHGDRVPEEGLVTIPFVDIYISFFLVIFGSDTMAIFVSSLVRKENTAMTIMPFVLIVQLVMAGAIFPLRGAMNAFSNVTVSKWGLDAILRVSNQSSELFSNNNRSYQYYLAYCQKTGEEAMKVDPESGKVLLAWGIMIALALAFLIGSMLILRLVDKDKRI